MQDEVADLIATQLGDDFLTDEPPFGTGLSHFATEVVAVSGTGYDYDIYPRGNRPYDQIHIYSRST